MKTGTNIDFARATAKFYERLFARFPGIKAQLADKGKRERMFVAILMSVDDAVHGRVPETAYLQSLHERHRMIGVGRVHITAAREAFAQAIEAGGRQLSEERRQLYLDAFTEIERAMGFATDGPAWG